MLSPFDSSHPHDYSRAADLSRATAIFSALSEPNRCLIFRILLGSQAIGVGEMARIVGISDPLVSQHLRTLREAGLVLREKEGKNVYYRINYDNSMIDPLKKIVDEL